MINHFDKIFIINLERRNDRWLLIKDHMEKFGLNEFERFPAIDGKNYPPFQNLPSKFKGWEGSLGCSYSHWGIAKRMLEENWERVWVIEDDCRFTQPISTVLSWLNQVIHLNCYIHLGNTGEENKSKIKKTSLGLHGHSVIGTHSYIMNKKIAGLLHSTLETNPYHSDIRINIDRLYEDILIKNGIEVIYPHTPLCTQDKASSTDVKWGYPDAPFFLQIYYDLGKKFYRKICGIFQKF